MNSSVFPQWKLVIYTNKYTVFASSFTISLQKLPESFTVVCVCGNKRRHAPTTNYAQRQCHRCTAMACNLTQWVASFVANCRCVLLAFLQRQPQLKRTKADNDNTDGEKLKLHNCKSAYAIAIEVANKWKIKKKNQMKTKYKKSNRNSN